MVIFVASIVCRRLVACTEGWWKEEALCIGKAVITVRYLWADRVMINRRLNKRWKKMEFKNYELVLQLQLNLGYLRICICEGHRRGTNIEFITSRIILVTKFLHVLPWLVAVQRKVWFAGFFYYSCERALYAGSTSMQETIVTLGCPFYLPCKSLWALHSSPLRSPLVYAT